MVNTPANEALATLSDLLGSRGWLLGDDIAPYERDWLGRYGTTPLGVARPSSTAETSAVVRICAAAGIAVVAQGGNTGLCGGRSPIGPTP